MVWDLPQKIAKPPPEKGAGEWPMIYCFRCGIPTVVLVREEGDNTSYEHYEERNGRQQIYVVLESDAPAANGSRMRLNLCGDCIHEFGPHEYDLVMPFVISGLEETARRQSGNNQTQKVVTSMTEEYKKSRPVKIESFHEAQNNVANMMRENETRAQAAILAEVQREREMQIATAQIKGRTRK